MYYEAVQKNEAWRKHCETRVPFPKTSVPSLLMDVPVSL